MEESEKVKDFFEILGRNLLKCLIYPAPYDILPMVLPVTVGGWPSLRGQLLLPPDLRKGGCPMVTYSDLIQLGILIVGIIGLFVQIKKK